MDEEGRNYGFVARSPAGVDTWQYRPINTEEYYVFMTRKSYNRVQEVTSR